MFQTQHFRGSVKFGSNWYQYCSGNPVNMVDPTGLFGRDDDGRNGFDSSGLSSGGSGITGTTFISSSSGAPSTGKNDREHKALSEGPRDIRKEVSQTEYQQFFDADPSTRSSRGVNIGGFLATGAHLSGGQFFLYGPADINSAISNDAHSDAPADSGAEGSISESDGTDVQTSSGYVCMGNRSGSRGLKELNGDRGGGGNNESAGYYYESDGVFLSRKQFGKVNNPIPGNNFKEEEFDYHDQRTDIDAPTNDYCVYVDLWNAFRLAYYRRYGEKLTRQAARIARINATGNGMDKFGHVDNYEAIVETFNQTFGTDFKYHHEEENYTTSIPNFMPFLTGPGFLSVPHARYEHNGFAHTTTYLGNGGVYDSWDDKLETVGGMVTPMTMGYTLSYGLGAYRVGYHSFSWSDYGF